MPQHPGDSGDGNVSQHAVQADGEYITSAAGEAGAVASSDRPSELAVVSRLRLEAAPQQEWRRAALAYYDDGRSYEFRQILEAAVEDAKQGASHHPDHACESAITMQLLAAHCVSCALSVPLPPPATVEAHLAMAKHLLDVGEQVSSGAGVASTLDAFTSRGFHALAQHTLHPNSDDELKRATILFDAALKLDNSSPRALLGKAVVYSRVDDHAKALLNFRLVLKRLAPLAPRSGPRRKTLNQLRFALAVSFLGLGRHEQSRNALSAIVGADSSDVEALCALAHLETKVSSDGVGKSMEYLDEAGRADPNHPVVLCQLANHAFICGLEDQASSSQVNETPEPWKLAKKLLTKVMGSSRSDHVLAEAHYQLGRLDHAKSRYDKAYVEYIAGRRLNPQHYACVYSLAQTCVQQHKFLEALPLLEEMKEKRGELPEVLKLLTYAYLMCGDKPKQAADTAEALVKKDKDDVEAWAMRAEAHDQLQAQQPSSATKAPKTGIEAYEHVARLLAEKSEQGGQTTASPQMWNNLGTLRGLQGDADGAKEAYNNGLALAESRLDGQEGTPSADEAKDLQVARLTMRFNRAWISESLGDQPNFVQATQDYMAINEEHNWFADTLLQLGSQWQRLGEVDFAVQKYQEAMKQNPVLAALMQAEVYRQQAEYTKAMQSADTAVRHARAEHFHYTQVFLGNLHFEVANSTATKKVDRDLYMKKALHNFTKALEKEKDSHYAANGIGMVFAHRGKLELAKRTFQSVMQHHGMENDPSVYINLGHTYLHFGGESARKAIALYHRALKMKPNDLTIRLYIAKAHFSLKEWEKCCGVLADATQLWPEDLLLRYNMAVALESHGVDLVSKEKKTNRVVGVDNGMDQMVHAVDLLGSAARLYNHVHVRWASMADRERKKMGAASGAPANLSEEMSRVVLHKEYCNDITDAAREELENLMKKKQAMDAQMRTILEEKKAREQQKKDHSEAGKQDGEEKQFEMEEHALRLMESGNDIVLGKDLGSKTLAIDKKDVVQRPPREPKEPKAPREPKERQTPKERAPKPVREKAEGEEVSGSGGSGSDDDAKPKGEPKAKPARKLTKKQKKAQKKKDKKQKKAAKKEDKKRKAADGDVADDDGDAAENVQAADGEGVKADAADGAVDADVAMESRGEPDLPIAESGTGMQDEEDDDARRQRKKEKKDQKKEKKDQKKAEKKAKKASKKAKVDSGSDAGSGGKGSNDGQEVAEGAEGGTKDLEDELFGTDDE